MVGIRSSWGESEVPARILRKELRQGALRRKHGLETRGFYIPPPYDQLDAIPISWPPLGAKDTGSRSPYETIQIIGKSGATVPHRVTKDLGWADIEILNGREIRFTGKGLETDVGTRDPSPTTGMSMEAGGGAVAKHRVVAASPAGFTVPDGSLVWATSEKVGKGVSRVSRVRWYYIPPSESGYTGEPIPLDGPPYGVSDPDATDPMSSLQIVGRTRTVLPSTDVSLDFADVSVVGGNIAGVTPKGETVVESDVNGVESQGSTVPPPVAPEGSILEPEEEHTVRPVSGMAPTKHKTRKGKSRVGLTSKKPKRTWLEEVATLKGFNPYTFEGS